MDLDWHKLEKKKIDDLREMAKDIPGVGAVSGMKKEALVEAVASHLGIDRPRYVISGLDKSNLKNEIKALKVERDAALTAHDSKELKRIRRAIHKRKRTLRQAAIIG